MFTKYIIDANTELMSAFVRKDNVESENTDCLLVYIIVAFRVSIMEVICVRIMEYL